MFHAKQYKPSETGKTGEDIALKFIENLGFKVLFRNYSKPWGEIDIIGKSKDKTLVFFEVKTIEGFFGDIRPEDNFTKEKFRRLSKTCEIFSARHPKLVDDQAGWRIDLIAITVSQEKPQNMNGENILTYKEKYFIVNHYKNI